MTELNDHLKLLFARGADLFDRETAEPVSHDSPESIYAQLQKRAAGFSAGPPQANQPPWGAANLAKREAWGLPFFLIRAWW